MKNFTVEDLLNNLPKNQSLIQELWHVDFSAKESDCINCRQRIFWISIDDMQLFIREGLSADSDGRLFDRVATRIQRQMKTKEYEFTKHLLLLFPVGEDGRRIKYLTLMPTRKITWRCDCGTIYKHMPESQETSSSHIHFSFEHRG